MSDQTSALARLRAMPPLFRGSELALRNEWSRKTVAQYLYLWRQRRLIEPLGGRADVYANLLFSHQEPDWDQALAMAMPSACLIGVEVLRRAGWVTQIPSRPDVAVRLGHPMYRVDERYSVLPRSEAWYRRTAAGRDAAGVHGSLQQLRPAWALADLLLATGTTPAGPPAWRGTALGPDDIDWAVLSPRDREDFHIACRAHGREPEEVIDGLDGGPDLDAALRGDPARSSLSAPDRSQRP